LFIVTKEFSVSERKPFTPESLFELRWASDVQLAPDGERVVWVEHWVEEIEKDQKKRQAYRTALYLSDGADAAPRRITFSAKGNDLAPRWSPDGTRLAFLSTRDDDKPQLFVLNLAGGEAEQLTRTKDLSEGVGEFDWHPSGRLLCFTSTGHKDEEAKKHEEQHDEKVYENHLPFKFNGQGLLDDRRAQLYRFSLDDGEQLQLTHHSRDIGAPTWSPDGRHIAFVSQSADTPEHLWVSDIFVISTGGDDLRQLTPTHGPAYAPAWSPDGTRIAYVGHDQRRGNASTTRVWLVELAEGSTPQCLTEGFEGSVDDIPGSDTHLGTNQRTPVWQGSEQIVFEAMEQGRAGLYRIAVGSGEVEQISTSGLSVVGFSQQGNTIAFTGETNARTAEVYTMSAGARPQRRSHTADTFFSTYRVQPPEHVRFRSADDWEIEGWFIRPLDAEEGQKYPLLIYIHGGPHLAYGNAPFHEFQVHAAAGYGVFYTNPRGSSSYGEEFTDAVRQHFGEKDFEDIMHAADLAASWEWVDPARMGVLGGSYGGFLTNWTITHTDRFAAACTQRSISNLYSFAGSSDIGPEFSRDEYGALPWDDEETLMAKSPIRYVENVRTPTLILHQEEDHRCPIEQAEQLYTALVMLGVPTKLVRFPGENHELPRSGQPQRRVNRMHHILDWFGRYLKQ
jgi:dipeptidyl aminopeptidase/acylaminoacyl peptidase